MTNKRQSSKTLLIIITFIVGLCSIVYELLISTISSYFLGDSVKQFSLIIGVYLASMGAGSFVTRYIKTKLILRFVYVEILLGLVGALSVPLCYYYFAKSDVNGYQFFVLFLISIIGFLTGFEIPLLTRILEKDDDLKDNLSNILTFDYLGALAATLLFPFFLVPMVGLYRSSLIFGLINIAVGVTTLHLYKNQIEVQSRFKNALTFFNFVLAIILGFMIYTSSEYLQRWNNDIYKYDVIYTETTPYQTVTVTKQSKEFRLYLNSAIQFSSRDEYRYHEALVHVPLQQTESIHNVLLLGGGEGLAAREILKYPELKSLTIVDIDPAITRISSKVGLIRELNEGALLNGKVKIVHEDAFAYLKQSKEKYDVIIADLPDPSTESLARLYCSAFYKLCLSNLSSKGVLCTQATSPALSKDAFWCIESTLRDAGFQYVYPYHANVPSFGDWGFVLAKHTPITAFDLREDIAYKYLENQMFDHIFYFPKDIRVESMAVNHLDQPIILDYYLEHVQQLQGQKK